MNVFCFNVSDQLTARVSCTKRLVHLFYGGPDLGRVEVNATETGKYTAIKSNITNRKYCTYILNK